MTMIVYPNPAADKQTYLSTNQLISRTVLIDLSGKIVYSSSVKRHDGSIDLKEIAKGKYLVIIDADNNLVSNKISIE